MSPILGIMASSISGSKAVTNSYSSIQTVTVGSGGASDVTFSSIPSTYTHLQIRGIAFQSSGPGGIGIQVSGDTGNNYTWHYVQGDGSSATASSATSNSNTYTGDVGTSTGPGAMILDILDYASTNKYKTFRSLAGYDANGSGKIALKSGVWMNTSTQINSIKIIGVTFAQYSTFALYGIKGA